MTIKELLLSNPDGHKGIERMQNLLIIVIATTIFIFGMLAGGLLDG